MNPGSIAFVCVAYVALVWVASGLCGMNRRIDNPSESDFES